MELTDYRACLTALRDQPPVINPTRALRADADDFNAIIGRHAVQNSILKAVIAESQPSGSGNPPFKFAVNSTIVQHLVPTSKLNKPAGGAAASEEASSAATSTDGKPHVGRRGMHSATGAYWNDKTDGMWTFKYEGDESKGMDVIVMLIWIGI